MNQLADRQLAGVQLTLPDKCSISAADPKPMFVVPSRSACGGSQTTVPSIFEHRADDLVQVDWLFLRTALA